MPVKRTAGFPRELSLVESCPISIEKFKLVVSTLAGSCDFAPLQMIVWISVTSPYSKEPGNPFPAVLDTGCNESLVISDPLIRAWADSRPYADLVRLDDDEDRPSIRGVKAARYAAQIWLHPNVPGSILRQPKASAVPLHIPDGIVVFPTSKSEKSKQLPRVPVLGMSAFLTRDWAVFIQTQQRKFDILPMPVP